MAAILIADDEEIMRDSLGSILGRVGHAVTVARDGRVALKKLAERSFDVVISDLRMPNLDGIELLKSVRESSPDTPVIVITAHGTVETAVEAMKLGAFDFITKPFGADEIETRVERALSHRKLRREAACLREIVSSRAERPLVTGGGEAMRELQSQIERVARSDSTVLILGESGTGKEVVARAIHALSKRAAKPFLAVNCAALSAGLLESELFGHEKGAFTGAERQRKGRFELAAGGTLLLDEVSEIDTGLQAKLLRVLQEKAFERVGSSETIRADVRVLATSNRDLRKEIKEGRFREDLYYRLNVVPLQVPPLRDRPEEIEALARHFLNRHARAIGRDLPELTADGLVSLRAYRWPGNVRELENLLERICVLEETGSFDARLLARYLSPGGGTVSPHAGFAGFPPDDVPAIADVERELIRFALKKLSGDRNAVASALGITTKTLRAKIQKWELDS